MRAFARFACFALLFGGPLAAGCGDDKPQAAASGGGNVGRAGTLGVGNRESLAGDGQGGSPTPEGGGASGAESNAGAGAGGVDLAVGGAPPGVCNDGKAAVITGRVMSPSGELPLGGVAVYVPGATVDSLPNGTGCWRCASAYAAPLALAITDADGRFEIDNAPVGDKVTLVVQTGKWQRKLALEVLDCTENAAPEADTRLPRKQSEGNLPAIALVSGGEDTLECLLRKLGIDDSEFAFATDTGRVRLYQAKGGIAQLDGVADSALTPAATLWSDAEKLSVFDLVLLGSEGDQNAAAKPSGALVAMHGYAAAGGRLLVQHFQNYFLSAGSEDVSGIATYSAQADLAEPFTVSVDEGSARGKALADSLVAADAQSTRGKLSVSQGKNSVTAVKPPALRLLYGAAPATVQAFSVDLPYGGAEPTCGRVTETELLTASGDSVADFPTGCTSTTLSAQERALAYLIFDLGACLP
jgi:hypothetical protein